MPATQWKAPRSDWRATRGRQMSRAAPACAWRAGPTWSPPPSVGTSTLSRACACDEAQAPAAPADIASLHEPHRQPGEGAGVAGAGEQAEDAGDVAPGLGIGRD